MSNLYGTQLAKIAQHLKEELLHKGPTECESEIILRYIRRAYQLGHKTGWQEEWDNQLIEETK